MPKVGEAVGNVRTRALELGLYLPVGAYAKVRDEVSEMNRQSFRKLFGELIDRGQGRVKPVQRKVRQRADQLQATTRGVAGDVARNARRTAGRAEAAVDTVAPKIPRVAAPKKASELPIKRYNSLTATEIISASRGLTQTELAKVYKFERGNQNRRTVLQGLESQFVELPIPTYDALTVAQISERLEGLAEAELKTLRRYEEGTKGRSTVIEKIDSLL